MIAKMKKMTFLVSEKERTGFLFHMRKAGVLHLKHVVSPLSHEVTFVEDKISNLEKMMAILTPYSGKATTKVMPCSSDDLQYMAQQISDACGERQDLVSRKTEAMKKIIWFNEWGEFDPRDLKRFEEKGLYIKLYKLKRKDEAEIPEGTAYAQIGKGKGYTNLAVFFDDPEKELPFDRVIPPEESPSEVKAIIDTIDGEISGIDQFLAKEAEALELMKECRDALEKEKDFFAAKAGMKQEGRFCYMEGYCPEAKVPRALEVAGRMHAGYLIEDASDEEETPTLIENPAWLRIIQPVFDFMSTIPGYKEFDISFVFLVFFSVFFAMLIGDAGYGLLFLVATFAAARKFKAAPKEPLILMYVLSAATIFWGAVNGSWFGLPQIAGIPVFKKIMIPALNTATSDGQNFVIYLCFVLGAVHLTIAHIMRAVRIINSLKALADAGWVMIIWGMFFAAGALVLGKPFPEWGMYLYGVGIPFVLFFTNPTKNPIKGALSTLTQLPLTVISSFGDIVSYLRLFAVGYASAMLSGTFNEMAFSQGKGFGGMIVAAVILFIGHTLNIILGFLAVAVHGIRLNMLEFSGHLGMSWSGKKYEPFKEH
ncbi:MAG: hypothetical protein PHW14_04485 [Candidatus Omnitrophica bacterium]|nr:hypothetical protein [Candidatus Omnitrophota bacterium]